MRLCSGPGCRRAIPDGKRFCGECQAERNAPLPQADDIRQHGGYHGEIDKIERGPHWKRVRDVVIKRDPLCKRCELRISEIADHIVPAEVAIAQAQESGMYPFDKYAGYYLLSNLQGLCRPCHYAKTIEDKTHTGPWPDVVAAEAAAPKKRWTF